METPQVITLEVPRPADIPLELAFAPLHKRALGTAIGTVSGLLIFVFTLVTLAIEPTGAPDLTLLAEYFYGYTVSVRGAFIGLLWGFFVGFVGGWFLAFSRNLALAVSIFITRTKAELQASREFLDHI
jgi:hypothetical protein